MSEQRVAIGPNGERTIYSLDTHEDGTKYWRQLPTPSDVESTVGAAYAGVAKKLQNAGSILQDQRSDVDKLREQEAKSLSAFDRAMIEAGQNTSGFLTGVPSALLKTKAFAKYLVGADGNGIPDMLSAMQMDDERAKERKLMREFNDNSGVAGTVGGMLPYVLTNVAAGPLANKVAGKALSGIERAANAVGSESKSLLERGVSAAANSELPGVEQFGKKATTEWVDALKNRAAEASKRPDIRQPYREGAGTDILGGGILGGIEGLLNSDLDTKSGIEAGLAGSLLGRGLKYKLEPAPLPDKPAYNELMDRRKAWGRRNTPGEVLDNPTLQTQERGYRNDKRTSQMMKYFDEANQKADNKYAFEAMGYNGDTLDRASLNAHVKALGNEYDELANSTSARLDKADLNSLRNHTLSLAGQSSDEGVKAAKAANDWLKKMQAFRKQQTTVRRSNGQFDAQTSAPLWQDLRSELKEDINAAYDRSEPRVAKALRPFLDTLNNAADRGIQRLGSTPEESAAILNKWKDVDERYAMSKIIKQHGLDDITLNISPTKLYNYFKGDSQERFITGNWGNTGRINRLYNIAEGRPLDLELAGSTLSSDNIKDAVKKKQTLREQLLSSPDALKPGLMDEMWLRAYLSPNFSPQVKGYSFGALNSNTPGSLGGIRKTGTYTKALAQSSQLTPTILDFLQHPYDKTTNWWEEHYGDKK